MALDVGGHQGVRNAVVVRFQGVQALQALQGGAGVGMLHQQTGQGHDGSQNTATQNRASNQGAHGHMPLHHQQRTGHHQARVAHLLQDRRQIAHTLGGIAHAQITLDGLLVVIDPARQKLPAARTGLDGFYAFYRFDQQAGAHIGEGRSFFGQLFDLAANAQTHKQRNAAKHQGHQGQQGGGNQGDDHQKQQAHGQVDQGEQGVCGVKTAHLLIATQLPGQAADRTRHLVHTQVQQLLKHFARQAVVKAHHHIVHQMRACHLHRVFNQDAERDPKAQHDQGVLAARGNHAVIHLHGKQRGGQRNDADEGRGQARLHHGQSVLPQGLLQLLGKGFHRRFFAHGLREFVGVFLRVELDQGHLALQSVWPHGVLPVRVDQDPLIRRIAVDHHRPTQVIRMAQQGQVSPIGSVQQPGLVQAHLCGYFFQLEQRR